MIPVVDLFAGPGGLNEGFSAHVNDRGERLFGTVASFEMDSTAVRTLQLRAALRRLGEPHGYPDLYYNFLNGCPGLDALMSNALVAKAVHSVAEEEIHQVELGEEARPRVDEIIRRRLGGRDPWVLIGGPPCQAYSLVGRARRTHDESFSEDKKHFLFREYLHIIETFRPTIFVMENVKGLLSATHSGRNMFQVIMDDLSVGGLYTIRSLVVDKESLDPHDYVVRAEQYGVPQRRHRVILVGLRNDAHLRMGTLIPASEEATVRTAIGGMPPVRSILSPRHHDSDQAWNDVRNKMRDSFNLPPLPIGTVPRRGDDPLKGAVRFHSAVPDSDNARLMDWLEDRRLEVPSLHEARAHMCSDLLRYEYLAQTMRVSGARPTVRELPSGLKPNHRNVSEERTPFLDRFKVQQWGRPSSTVTSHIAKDGHYYIHPDPDQMRSLTVREAARLQTFPDDYFFMGNRTSQYHQVGNAVPPYLAKQIAQVVATALRG